MKAPPSRHVAPPARPLRLRSVPWEPRELPPAEGPKVSQLAPRKGGRGRSHTASRANGSIAPPPVTRQMGVRAEGARGSSRWEQWRGVPTLLWPWLPREASLHWTAPMPPGCGGPPRAEAGRGGCARLMKSGGGDPFQGLEQSGSRPLFERRRGFN